MKGRILLIDDEELFREDNADLLRQEGYRCETAAEGPAGLRLAKERAFDMVLCDLVMPGMTGIEVAKELKADSPDVPVLLITAYGSLQTAIEAFREGVADYLLKPVLAEDLLSRVSGCLERRNLEKEVRYLRSEVSEISTGIRLVGNSPPMQELRELIAKVAPTDSTVLITGESGTGKDLVARIIQQESDLAERPFVTINCAALPSELLESELFGHARGAFTGAVRDKPGLFELARDGTLFLDEVVDVPFALQGKLLRALEKKEFFRVGDLEPIKMNARILAASNRSFHDEIEAGNFREDLYYRLQVVEIRLAPLRDRRGDIPDLVAHILRRLNARLKRGVTGVEPAALELLQAAPWRGNVRELENVLERAVILCDGPTLGPEDLPVEIAGAEPTPETATDLRTAVGLFERRHIQRMLQETGGNREEAARRLGIDPSTLYRRLKDIG